jgi:glutamate/tyrosine decarboxylase-like PLP-dependent enzyme
MSRDDVLHALDALRGDDLDWRTGRVFSMVYDAGEDVEHLLQDAARLYSTENALNPLAFPSTGRMQQDIVDIAADLLGGTEVDGVTGWMTSGGTESILMAVKTARDHARATRDETAPEMVLATTAHAAFSKAAHYFGVEEVRVPVGEDYRVDVPAMSAAITDHTVLVVGSAPQYPQGVMDPISEIAALAADAGALCHVDACMGGFVLPFLVKAGRPIPPFDFRVPGVTSLSADVHKYGYANKGASVVLYRDESLRKRQAFVFRDWLGGFYASSGVSGSKPTSPYAAAWAVLHYLGEDGYQRLAEQAFDGRVALEAGVRAVPGLTVVGEPEVTLCAIAAEDPAALDVFLVGDELRARGWYFDRQSPPDSLHATVQASNVPNIASLLADLTEVVAAVGARRTADRSTEYASLE